MRLCSASTKRRDQLGEGAVRGSTATMSARGFMTSSTRRSWKARAWLTSSPVAAGRRLGRLVACAGRGRCREAVEQATARRRFRCGVCVGRWVGVGHGLLHRPGRGRGSPARPGRALQAFHLFGLGVAHRGHILEGAARHAPPDAAGGAASGLPCSARLARADAVGQGDVAQMVAPGSAGAGKDSTLVGLSLPRKRALSSRTAASSVSSRLRPSPPRPRPAQRRLGGRARPAPRRPAGPPSRPRPRSRPRSNRRGPALAASAS